MKSLWDFNSVYSYGTDSQQKINSVLLGDAAKKKMSFLIAEILQNNWTQTEGYKSIKGQMKREKEL